MPIHDDFTSGPKQRSPDGGLGHTGLVVWPARGSVILLDGREPTL